MEREAEYREFLKAKVAENGYKFALLLVTDIFNEGSKFICEGDVTPVSEAFGIARQVMLNMRHFRYGIFRFRTL